MNILKNIVPRKYQVSDKEYDRRMFICNSCPVLVRSTGSCGTLLLGSEMEYNGKKIVTCGCIISEKAILKSQKCDLGKWKKTGI